MTVHVIGFIIGLGLGVLIYVLYICCMDSVLIDTKRLWTISEYSKQKGITRKTLYSWIEDKKLKSVRVNGTTLIIE
jgi:excisionase family DNA binding protein